MTRNTKVSKTRFLFTILSIALFVVVVVKADAFSNSMDERWISVNPNFIWSEDTTVGINPDYINILEDENESPVIHYIVQEGDSLEKISKEFWVPVKDLKKLNKIRDQINPWQKLIVSDKEDGILYEVKKERSLKLFAEFYRLNIEDLMTFNYISDDSEMLYPGQELFINITEQRAMDIGLIEKPQPKLPKDELPKPKYVAPKKTSNTSNGGKNVSSSNASSASSTTSAATSGKKSRIIKQWYYNPKISNGFAVGYCTWYAAMQVPSIFKYTSASKQERLFGGNAKHRYANAKAAGISVGQTPRVGAIIVYGQLRSAAWHVGIVRAYYPDSGEMIVEDMNYVGKYIVTQRWENVNRSWIIGYVYP